MKANAYALIVSILFVSVASAEVPRHEGTVPQFRSNDNQSPLALEYRLGTHVEAVARKYGRLDTFAKACNLPEYWNFEEDSLADLVGDNLTTSTVGIVKRSYAEGKELKTPPCDQSANFVGLLVEQVERHRSIIWEISEQLTALSNREEPR